MRHQERGSNITEPCVIGTLLTNTIITRCRHAYFLLRHMELHSCPFVRVTCPLIVWNSARECKIWRAAIPDRCVRVFQERLSEHVTRNARDKHGVRSPFHCWLNCGGHGCC